MTRVSCGRRAEGRDVTCTDAAVYPHNLRLWAQARPSAHRIRLRAACAGLLVLLALGAVVPLCFLSGLALGSAGVDE